MESDDRFQKRLDEVNQELADTLKRNEEQRYQLLQSHKHLGNAGSVYHNPRYSTGGSGAYDALSTAPYVMTNSDHVAKEISIAVAREMQNYESRVQAMVEREWEIRLQGLDQQLRTRFAEMSTMHERMTQVLMDTSKGLEHHKKQTSKQMEKLERMVEDQLDEFRKDLRSSVQDIQREVRSLKDQVNEGQIDARADAKEVSRRIDDTQRRIAGMQHEVELGVDSKLVTIRQELLDKTKADLRRQEDDIEAFRRSLATVQGQMERAEGKVTAIAEDVQGVEDTGITQSSQIRTLTADLAQLELLTKRRLEKSDSRSDIGGGGKDRMQSDIFSLKQSVAYLASVLEANGLVKTTSSGEGTSNRENFTYKQKDLSSDSSQTSDDD